jgi:hypothetical protein
LRSLFILGAGRSGTSLSAGLLADAGYFMGDELIPPRDANPKGFFEDAEVNGINEELLIPLLHRRPRLLGRWVMRDRLTTGQRWLAALPAGTIVASNEAIDERIQELVARRPFCFKDPRFAYTLPAWQRYAPEAAMVCVFREPGRTAASIVKECETALYLRGLRMDVDRAVEVWERIYENILDKSAKGGDWLFLHFDQLFTPDGIQRLERFAETRVDHEFADYGLRRSSNDVEVSENSKRLYAELSTRAGYEQ